MSGPTGGTGFGPAVGLCAKDGEDLVALALDGKEVGITPAAARQLALSLIQWADFIDQVRKEKAL